LINSAVPDCTYRIRNSAISILSSAQCAVRRYKLQLTRLLEMVDQHKLAIASGELDKMPPLGMFYHHFYIPDTTC
jgi:hypothetical protein